MVLLAISICAPIVYSIRRIDCVMCRLLLNVGVVQYNSNFLCLFFNLY